MKKVYLLCLIFLTIFISCESNNDDVVIEENQEEMPDDDQEEMPDDTDSTDDDTSRPFEIPGPDNTGVKNESVLVDTGDVRVTDSWDGGGSGTVEDPFIVENFNIIDGSLKILTSNVIVRNFRISVNALYPVNASEDDMSNVIIEDGEIIGGVNSSAAILAKNGVTLRRLNIHETGGDGVKVQGSNFTMESCWIYNLGMKEGSHADGVQCTINGDGTRLKNHVYRGNFFDMAVDKLDGMYQSNITIFLHVNDASLGTGAGIDGVILEENWLIGGNFSVTIEDGMTDLIIKNNKFGRVGKEVRFINIRVDSPGDISGNVYYDNLNEPVID